MDDSLCTRFRFDDTVRRERLEMVELCTDDHRWAEHLRDEVIRPHLADITRRMRRATRSTSTRLLRAQTQGIESLGWDFDTEGYFEGRLRLALAHWVANVPLSSYACIQRACAEAMLDHLPPSIWRNRVQSFALKILALDASLAADLYTRATG